MRNEGRERDGEVKRAREDVMVYQRDIQVKE